MFALFYYESNADIYGWHIEAKGHYFSAAFFMIENFYANRATRLYRSIEDDVYGQWTIDYPPTRDEIRCPAPEEACHELERLQSRFVEEWLFFQDDPNIAAEVIAYREHGIPVQEVNIRWRRMNRMEKRNGLWSGMATGIDLNIVELLRKYWRLSEKVPAR
ncbi:hypothetical protein D3870_11185 [Noviherbaspirillum cavernae]|uniref:Uncharacterized protein n=1 Tax=Noviherbaspirillum cavernae TaxID=2320862 RepID=A0A418X232_9BURK|nr:hypothetical protein D3870_11185 [Noviherbaspirillum cavernae]